MYRTLLALALVLALPPGARAESASPSPSPSPTASAPGAVHLQLATPAASPLCVTTVYPARTPEPGTLANPGTGTGAGGNGQPLGDIYAQSTPGHPAVTTSVDCSARKPGKAAPRKAPSPSPSP